MIKIQMSFLMILMGLLTLPAVTLAAIDEQNVTVDQQTDAIKVLAFGRPVLPTGAAPTGANAPTLDVVEPALDPSGDLGVSLVSPVTPNPIAPGLLGDFNNNGFVNAADYVTWRKNGGQPINLPNSNNDGTTDAADYNDWRGNFGNS